MSVLGPGSLCLLGSLKSITIANLSPRSTSSSDGVRFIVYPSLAWPFISRLEGFGDRMVSSKEAR